MNYELKPGAPIVTDIELSEGEGTFIHSDGVTELKLFMTQVTMSNGSTGPVIYSAPAIWKLFGVLHQVFGDQWHKMVDNPEYLQQIKDMNE